jgi:pimeloyl-ACP methyl ester carboxylesterase
MDVRARNNITFTGREQGPVVMLAPGFGCDQNMWRLITETFGEQSRLLLFDHVGAGRSDLNAWDPDRYATLDWSVAMAPVIMGNPERPELGEELTTSFCRTEPSIAKAFAKVTFLSDHRADLPKGRVPTLVVQSAADAIAPPEVGAYVRDRIAGSRLVTLAATGHCPQLSTPQATAQAITAFVAERR